MKHIHARNRFRGGAVALCALLLCAMLPLGACSVAGGGTETDSGCTDSYVVEEELLGYEDGSVVKWEGRYEYKEGDSSEGVPDMVYLYHTATGFTVSFTGTELVVGFYSDINNKPYYNVAVDDETLPNPDEERTFFLSGGYEEITVVSGLESGTHTVQCLKMSEPYDADTAVYFFETDGNFEYYDEDDAAGSFRFMVVCASGGSGHGSLAFGYSSSHARTTANSSSLHAFNYLTARMFGADVQFVANSGWGVKYPKSISAVMDYTGITKENTVSAAKKTAEWDYSSWVPDVILFNIGGNDTVSSDFSQSDYQEEVVAMVESLHEHYPDAYMLWTHTGSKAGSYALTALSDARADYVTGVRIPGVAESYEEYTSGSGTYGANNHQSLKTHIDSAEIIASALEEIGFTRLRDNISFEDFENILEMF